MKKPIAQKEQEKEGLDSSEDEEFNSDDELDEFEELSDNELLIPEISDEEDLDDDDMDQLLAMSEEKKPNNKKKSVKQSNESDEEMDYESKPRKIASEWSRKDYHTKLPIKLPGGKLYQVAEPQEGDSSEDEEEKKEEVPVVVEKVEEPVEEEEQPRLSKKEYLLKKKEELALIAGNLQGDPEEYVGQLRTLRSIYRDKNVTVKKLALLTQLAVYKDIIPGYRIRPLSALEEEVQVSRDIKKMREYEKSLLANYELYLKDLNVLLSSKFVNVFEGRNLVTNSIIYRKEDRGRRIFSLCRYTLFMWTLDRKDTFQFPSRDYGSCCYTYEYHQVEWGSPIM